jgi:hypothetical protein
MNHQDVMKNIVSPFILVIGVLLLTNPVVGYSRLLPKSIFELIFGGLLLASGVLLYRIGTGTE